LLYFFVILDAGAFFVIRGVSKRTAALPVADWLLYLIGGIGALGAALLFFGDVHMMNAECFFPPCINFSPTYGAVFAVVAALAICAAAILKRGEPQPPPGRGSATGLVFGILALDVFALAIYGLGHLPPVM
jgi:hypothetical protein